MGSKLSNFGVGSMICFFDSSNCRFNISCESINRGCSDSIVCIDLVRRSLECQDWKERAIYKFEPYQSGFDKTRLSLQVRNPLFETNIPPEKFEGIESYYIPIVAMEKPLAYDINITVNDRKTSSVLNRTDEAKALAPILLEEILWVQQSLYNPREFSSDERISFLAALISSNGGTCGRNDIGQRSLRSFLRDSVFGYIDGDTANGLENEIQRLLGDPSQLLGSIMDSLALCRKISKRLWYQIRRKNPDLEIERIVLVDKLLRSSVRVASICKTSNLINPINAVKDFFYVRGEATIQSLTKFVKLCSAYSIGLKNQVSYMSEAMALVYNKYNQNQEFPNSHFLRALVNEFEQMNVLRYFIDKWFLLFISLPINERRMLIKCDVVDRNKFHMCSKSHPVNLRAAQSVHFQITSEDVGYYIGLAKAAKKEDSCEHIIGRNDPFEMFGKIVETQKIIHGNTRKKGFYKPFSKISDDLLENLNIENHIFNVRSYYKLSRSVSIYLFSLLMMSLFGLMTVISSVSIDYSYIDCNNPLRTALIMILSNRIVRQDFSGTEQALVFLLAFIPLVGTLISTFMLTNWSVVHHLIRWYKRFILSSSVTAIIIIILVQLRLPLFVFGPPLFLLRWIFCMLSTMVEAIASVL